MQLVAHAVAETVHVAGDGPGVGEPGRVAPAGEIGADRLVQLPAAYAGERRGLGALERLDHRPVGRAERLRRVADAEGARAIGEQLAAREEIDDQGLPRSQHALGVALIVRHRAFLGRRDDVAFGLAHLEPRQRERDFAAQSDDAQRLALEPQLALANRGVGEDLGDAPKRRGSTGRRVLYGVDLALALDLVARRTSSLPATRVHPAA